MKPQQLQKIHAEMDAARKVVIEPLLDSAASAYMTSGPPPWESYEGHVRNAFNIGYIMAARKYSENGEGID